MVSLNKNKDGLKMVSNQGLNTVKHIPTKTITPNILVIFFL